MAKRMEFDTKRWAIEVYYVMLTICHITKVRRIKIKPNSPNLHFYFVLPNAFGVFGRFPDFIACVSVF